MASIWLLCVGLLVYSSNIGNCLKCYRYRFSNITGFTNANASQVPCKVDGHERCLNIRARTIADKQGKRSIFQWQDCDYSFSMRCRLPNDECEDMNRTANYKLDKCEIGCCEGDLCNSRGRPISAHVAVPKGPISGPDLTCYSCVSKGVYGFSLHNLPTADCNNPVKKTCGYQSSKRHLLEDRCMTITIKQNGTAKIIRNCSDPYLCYKQLQCHFLNETGTLKSCDVACCYGNLCNGTTMVTTPPPQRHQYKSWLSLPFLYC